MNNWTDFTESAYSNLLSLAKEQYEFIGYTSELNAENIVLWRHDVDFSVHRALRLAEIESEHGVASTFFFQLSCIFYNVFEHTILERIRRIEKLGHVIGLHFDPSLYEGKCKEAILEKMAWEKTVLENLFETEIHTVSFHNPEYDDWLSMDAHTLCGMVNTYSRFFKENFGYCSDSNGYWRFESIESVLRSRKHSRLQVLTHPAWWTAEPLPPRKRILRCVEGRAKRCMEQYDGILADSGRLNIDD